MFLPPSPPFVSPLGGDTFSPPRKSFPLISDQEVGSPLFSYLQYPPSSSPSPLGNFCFMQERLPLSLPSPSLCLFSRKGYIGAVFVLVNSPSEERPFLLPFNHDSWPHRDGTIFPSPGVFCNALLPSPASSFLSEDMRPSAPHIKFLTSMEF